MNLMGREARCPGSGLETDCHPPPPAPCEVTVFLWATLQEEFQPVCFHLHCTGMLGFASVAEFLLDPNCWRYITRGGGGELATHLMASWAFSECHGKFISLDHSQEAMLCKTGELKHLLNSRINWDTRLSLLCLQWLYQPFMWKRYALQHLHLKTVISLSTSSITRGLKVLSPCLLILQ